MKCKYCDAIVDLKDEYCFSCGSKLKEEKKENKIHDFFPLIGLLFSIFTILILGIFIYFDISSHNNSTIYFNDTIFEPKSKSDPYLFSYFSTSITYDNQFNYKKVSDINEASKYIKDESLGQRKKCGNNLILNQEKNLEKSYNIDAVNLCELSTKNVGNISKVFQKTYAEFPNIKGYMTNITLMNPTADDDFIASFKPIFQFVNEKGNIKIFPWVIKTQMLLNSNYYLNGDYLDNAINSSVGWFVKEADGYSIISHELGHYLSFVALLKKYNINSIKYIESKNLDKLLTVNQELQSGSFSKEIVDEAIANYNEKYGFITLDSFQRKISRYANNDILDETIAEAYHDYYLHGNNASPASLEIINVLKERLN